MKITQLNVRAAILPMFSLSLPERGAAVCGVLCKKKLGGG
jgi:hypothetical protein